MSAFGMAVVYGRSLKESKTSLHRRSFACRYNLTCKISVSTYAGFNTIFRWRLLNMTEWQLNFELVPIAVAATHRLSHGVQITDTQRRKIDWWQGQSLSPDALERLNESLPRKTTNTTATF
jgi:hypothetical protein